MGMFDYVRCLYSLPDGEDGAALEFQTKDTDAQMLDQYEIRSDGTLWHEAYETEDRSDPNAEGLMKFAGMMTRINQRWEPVAFHGDLNFYTSNVTGGCQDGVMTDEQKTPATYWDYTALFQDGRLINLRGLKTINHDEKVLTREEFWES